MIWKSHMCDEGGQMLQEPGYACLQSRNSTKPILSKGAEWSLPCLNIK